MVLFFALGGCGGKDEEAAAADAGTIQVDRTAIAVDRSGLAAAPEEVAAPNDTSDETEDAETVSGTEPAREEVSEEDAEPSEESGPVDGADDAAPDDSGDVTEDDAKTAPAPVNAEPGSVTQVGFDSGWQFGDHSKINSGSATLYTASAGRKGVVIGINAGHGTKGGQSVKTYCHPDMSPKVTGGSTGAGSITAVAVSGGMTFADGTSEAAVTLKTSQMLRDRLLSMGYDVMMLRDGSDVQLDNVARTVLANNTCACLISLHWDGDGLGYDKGCFYISTPDALKGMEPVSSHWQQHEALGSALISGLKGRGCKIYGGGSMDIDLTQTSYSTIPSVDIELGNQASAHDDAALSVLADGLADGVGKMF